MQQQCNRSGDSIGVVLLDCLGTEDAGVVLRKFGQQSVTEIVETNDRDDRERQHQRDAQRQYKGRLFKDDFAGLLPDGLEDVFSK